MAVAGFTIPEEEETMVGTDKVFLDEVTMVGTDFALRSCHH